MSSKKLLATAIAATIILFNIVGVSFAFAQNNPTVYSSFSGNVSAGENVRIPISVKDNQGLIGFMLNFQYDADVLTPLSVEYGSVFSGGLQDNIEGDAKPGEFKVYWAGSENNYSNGVMFYINARISDTAVGSAEIGIGYSQGDTFDEDFNDVELNCENIGLTIQNSLYSQYAKISANASDVVAGKNVEVKLNISDMINVNSADLKLKFDSLNFEFVSAQSTVTFNKSVDGDELIINLADIANTDNNTDIVTLIFMAKDKAISGDYAFELSSGTDGINCKSASIKIMPSETSEIAEISIPEGLAIEKGEISEIPVTIRNNHGIMGYRLTFDYNPEEIEVLSVKGSNTVSGELSDSIGVKTSSFDVLWNNTQEFSTDGLLFSIEVKNISNIYKQSRIGISYSQQDTFNEKYEDVVFDCQSADIKLCPGHSYNQQRVNPTCTQKGYINYTCIYCSDTYKGGYTDEIGHYYKYTGNQKDYVMTYKCVDCNSTLSVNADEVLKMWNSSFINIKPNPTTNRTKTDNSSLLNVVDNGIINAKDYALLLNLQKSADNNLGG